MDKYEEKLKLDELKKLVEEEKYKQAEEIADTMNWKKTKNINDLVLASEIYKYTQRYDECRELLLMAYDRSPIGRKIIYMIAELAIEMGNFDEATEFYDEFIEIAPHDNSKYVLRYHMKKAQGATLEEQIALLEELKEQEYTEKWAYELASLYHQAGKPDKAMEVCDELVLWFGEGVYVQKALELKMLYQPLTPDQEKKYRSFVQNSNEQKGIVEILPEEELESGEIVNEPVMIPKVKTNTEKFNTMNLQQELAKSMQKIMDATEKETVSHTMDNIKKMVEDIPYLQIPTETEVDEKIEDRFGHVETDKEIDDSLRINFREILAEENDGQLSLNVPQKAMIERQITGQMSIAEVLDEWEKTKYAAEIALQDATQRKLESAKARALQEAEDIMERLKEVLPQLADSNDSPNILENVYLKGDEQGEEAAGRFVAGMNQFLQKEIEKLSKTTEDLDQMLEVEKKQSQKVDETIQKRMIQQTKKIPNLEKFMNSSYLQVVDDKELKEQEQLVKELQEELIEDLQEEPAEKLQEEPTQEDWKEDIEKDIENDEVKDQIDELSEEIAQELEPIDEQEDIFNQEEIKIEQIDEEQFEKEQFEEEQVEEEQIEEEQITQDTMDETCDESDEDFDEEPKEDEGTIHPYQGLSEEDKDIFTYFMSVNGMSQQIDQALKDILDAYQKKEDGKHLVITGLHGGGKTVLATGFVKVLQQYAPVLNGKIGKIKASVLNQKEISTLLKKVENGCLIIENAGDLSKETAIKLGLCMPKKEQGVFVILEDTKEGIKKALGRDEGFASQFQHKINVPIFTIDELVLFAKAFANEQGYDIDEMAMLALYDSINKVQRLNEPTNLEDVKEIVEDAIVSANKGVMKKIRNIFASKRRSENGYISLREKDFDE